MLHDFSLQCSLYHIKKKNQDKCYMTKCKRKFAYLAASLFVLGQLSILLITSLDSGFLR